MNINIVPFTEYQNIFLCDQPLIDCRAPIEFEKGAFPSSSNLPLMTDNERQQVGTCYKKVGQQAALELGNKLVSGSIKQQRVDAWLAYIKQHPNAYLYCFRGGLRSQFTQAWIKEAGIDIPFVEGGYKSMRQYLLNVIEASPSETETIVLSGITGSGKTDFLIQRQEAIDLEGIANHRGSSFGKKIDPQPSQINFENKLAVALLKHQQRNTRCLLLEDESFLIGRSALPTSFYQHMQDSNLLVLEEPLNARLDRLLNDYVHIMHSEYVKRLGEEKGFIAFSDYLKQSITGIKKRLGGLRHDQFQMIIDNALHTQQTKNDTSDHLEWISLLLTEYYDPMYQYQLDKKKDRILFSGDHQAMHEWIDDYESRK